jgi:hypothetical protein
MAPYLDKLDAIEIIADYARTVWAGGTFYQKNGRNPAAAGNGMDAAQGWAAMLRRPGRGHSAAPAWAVDSIVPPGPGSGTILIFNSAGDTHDFN